MKKSLFFLENCLQATVTAKNIPLGQSRNITQYADEATVLYWVWATVGGMVALVFLLILLIFIRRTLALQKLEIESKYTEQYQNLLAQWLLGDLGLADLKRTLHYPTLFKNQILLFHKNLDGDDADKLRQLYYDCDFPKKAIFDLKYAINWEKRLRNMQELTAMQITIAYPLIFKLAKNKNAVVKLAAMRAQIQFSEQPFDFLNNQKHPLSMWQQAHLLQTFQALSLDRHAYLQVHFDQYKTQVNPIFEDFVTRIEAFYSENRNDIIDI